MTCIFACSCPKLSFHNLFFRRPFLSILHAIFYTMDVTMAEFLDRQSVFNVLWRVEYFYLSFILQMKAKDFCNFRSFSISIDAVLLNK